MFVSYHVPTRSWAADLPLRMGVPDLRALLCAACGALEHDGPPDGNHRAARVDRVLTFVLRGANSVLDLRGREEERKVD